MHYLGLSAAAAVIGVSAGIWAHFNSIDPETAATQCFAEKMRTFKIAEPDITEPEQLDAFFAGVTGLMQTHFTPCKQYVDAWKARADEKVIARRLMRVALVEMVKQADNEFQKRLANGLIKVIDEAEAHASSGKS